MAELVVVLPQLGDQLGALQLDLGVGGQVASGRALLDHSVGLHVQVPVDAGGRGFIVKQLAERLNHAHSEQRQDSELTQLACRGRAQGRDWGWWASQGEPACPQGQHPRV